MLYCQPYQAEGSKENRIIAPLFEAVMPLFRVIPSVSKQRTAEYFCLPDYTNLMLTKGRTISIVVASSNALLKYSGILVVVLTFISFVHIKAQDVGFSQFYAAPLYLNPAFAGQTECGRIGLQYRNQWPGMEKAFRTFKVSYDQHLPAINSGYGFQLMQDQQGAGTFNRTAFAAHFASQVRIGMRSTLSAGIKAGALQDALNWEALKFPDKLHNGTTGELPPDATTRLSPDFGAGLVFSWDEYLFAGISADHINRPDLSMFGQDNRALPMRWTLHAGWNIYTNQQGYAGRNDESLLIQPNVLFLQQGAFSQLNAGIYLSKYPFVAGSWFRHTVETADALQVMIGLTVDKFAVGYSYDITVSGIGLNAGGAHEVSLSWELCIERETKRKIRAIKLPVF